MTGQTSPTLNLDGYTDLPPGKIASIVTYLEMRGRPRLPRTARPAAWTLQPLAGDVGRYRELFRRVGEPWLWFSRAVMPDEGLAAILGDPRVQALALHDGAQDIGLLEIDFRFRRAAELSFLGVVPGTIGQGAGRYLMNEAIRRAFRRPIERLFVHTCSLDHPAALAFYMRSGFTPYKRAIEVSDDPRLLGYLTADVAAHVPVLPAPDAKRTRRAAARPRKLRASVTG